SPSLDTTAIRYTYDKVSNRLAKTVDNQTTSYFYDDNDRLLSEGQNTYEYDANGNTIGTTTESGNTTYSYDYQNRLTEAATSTKLIQYAYNHEGIRVLKRLNGTETRYLIDANRPYQQVLEEYENNELAALYIYGDDLISRDTDEWSYYLYDGTLSTRQLITAGEVVTDTYTYDAFGNLLNHNGSSTNTLLYGGEQYDPALGFYHLRARYYDQNLGRFITTDSFNGFQNDPQSLHKYLYAHANPVMNSDPSGMVTLKELGTAMKIGALLGAVGGGAGTYAYHKAYNKELTFSEFMKGVGIGAAAGAAGPVILAQAWGQYVVGMLFAYGVYDVYNLTVDIVLNENTTLEQKAYSCGLIVSYLAGSAAVFKMQNIIKSGSFKLPLKITSPNRLRIRHHTSPEYLNGIKKDNAINPARGGGVHVEIEPFGPVRTAKAETGAFAKGAYVEFDAPLDKIPSTNVGPRNTGVIPTESPLPLDDLNPTFKTTPWWNFWIN
ncbi:MAG: RHS repeat-associated core domain-containing protein, partial [Desulfobulbaceae bacterium]|nr:RHS repeat-associated core domain-containing protein [Desulfobulbaceae bacterium]